MSRSLPETPSLEHLKKEAKELLAAQRRGELPACRRLRSLPRFREATDEAIAGAKLSLAEAQQVVATSYGYKNWSVLKRLTTDVFVPPRSVEASFFRDYRWVKDPRFPTGRPVGVGAIDPEQADGGFFKFVCLGDGERVEQYDDQKRFVRVIHDPADRNRGTRKLTYQDNGRTVAAVRVDESCVVRVRETYSFLSSPDDRFPLVKAEIHNADGRLLEVHTPKRVGPAAQDICVTDALGKAKVILHHEHLDKGEPVTIREKGLGTCGSGKVPVK